METKIKTFIILAVTALLAVGCAHYQKGDGNTLSFSTVAIAPIENHSFAPQARTYVSEALMSTFAMGGKLTVLPEDLAETTLHVSLTSYNKNIGARSSQDTGVARSLQLVLTAHVELKDSTGNLLYSRDIEVHNEVYADSGAVRAENKAIPAMAHALAEEIYLAVTSNW